MRPCDDDCKIGAAASGTGHLERSDRIRPNCRRNRCRRLRTRRANPSKEDSQMRTLGLLRERWIAFWRAANDLALAMDADPFEDIYGRVARLEAAVHGRAAAHPVPGSPASSQDSSPGESRMASNQRKRVAMQVRKVVTGHDAEGRAVIARDEEIDGMPIPGLGELAFLWGADEPATYPNAGDNPAAPGPFPPVAGICCVLVTYSPESDVVAPEPLPWMHVEDGSR